MAESQAVIAAFSQDQAERLTGITKGQLTYWDQTDFFKPSFGNPDRRFYSRIYSFRDIVSLRVLNQLRNDHEVSLQHLRDVKIKLANVDETGWQGVRLYVFNKRVYWVDPETELPQEIASQQYAAPYIELDQVVADSKRDVDALNKRDQSEIGVITRQRYLMQNAPVIAGTRILVTAIKRYAEAGFNAEQILREYPDLTLEDVKAALEYVDPKKTAAA